ncbi:MAG: hypothetical protein R6V12_16480, partial [Candidatus Hydrogenedentota bacterium]
MLAAATLLILLGTCGLIYSIPWRVSSWDDLPNAAGMQDHWVYYLPNAYYMDVSLHDHGEFPLWNPLTFCGMPFAANPQAMAFYPPNLIRSILTFNPTPFRSHATLVAMLAFHVLLAGYSTYLLAREHGLSYGASLVCVFSFLFSAGVVRRTLANVYLTTIAWAPLALLLLSKSLRARTRSARIWYAVATGLVLGLGLLSKVSQMGIYLVLTVALYALLERAGLLDRQTVKSKKALGSLLLLDGLTGVIIVTVAVLVAAGLFLPGAEFAQFSGRGEQPHPSGMPLTFLRSTEGLTWLSKIFVLFTAEKNHFSHYKLAGLGTTLLALAALHHPRKRHVLKFGVLFLFFLDCSMGPPLPFSRICLGLAPFSFGSLGRAMMWSCFPLAMLAGFGADAIAVRWEQRQGSLTYSIFLVVVGGAGLVWLYQMVHPHDFLHIGNEVVFFPLLLLIVVLLTGLAGKLTGKRNMAWRTGWGRFLWHRGVIAGLLAIVVFCELVSWNWRYVPYLLEWRGFSEDVQHLHRTRQFWADNKRGLENAPNTHVLELSPAINGYDPLCVADAYKVIAGPHVYERISLPIRPPVINNLRSAFLLKRSFWLADEYVLGTMPPSDELFPPTTTVYMQTAPKSSELPSTKASSVRNSAVSKENATTEILNAAQVSQKVAHKEGGPFFLEMPSFAVPPRHSVLRLEYHSNCDAELTTWLSEGRAEPEERLYKKFHLQSTAKAAQTIEIPLPDCEIAAFRLCAVMQEEDGNLNFGRIVLASDTSDEDRKIRITERSPNSVA